MLYFIEALGFVWLFYHLADISKGLALKVATAILIVAIIFDPVLYSLGFIWTAQNYLQSIFINCIAYCGALIGVLIKCSRTSIQG